MQGMGCRIICTQPRRLAATSIAHRVSTERGEQMGHTVGYQIRLDSCISPQTSLIYTTSGFLLRCLMSSKYGELFETVTHLILDEVHEREKITDFLLIAIKDALALHPNLKIILMSATLDSEVFSKYFHGCPVVNVPGRAFPVDIYHLGEVLQLTGFKTTTMDHFMKNSKGPKLVRQSEPQEQMESGAMMASNSRGATLPNGKQCVKINQMENGIGGGESSCRHLTISPFLNCSASRRWCILR